MDTSTVEKIFIYLSSLIPNATLFMVGGSSRDFLLKRDFNDFDFATSLTPDEMRASKLNEVDKIDFAFIKYGTVNLKYMGYQITLASFRKEGNYLDGRHPSSLEFIKDPYIDSCRRDFTINAIYLDSSFKPFDPQGGLKDLNEKTIRMIGDIPTRLMEDPLRMIRAYRFSLELGFKIEDNLSKFISSHLDLIQRLRPAKVAQEINKINKSQQTELNNMINGKMEPR